MLSLNALSILALISLTCAQKILSTVTSQETSTELVCNTIMTDKSVEPPLQTFMISTTIETQPPVLATSTNAPSVFTLTLPAIFETSTVLQIGTITFMNIAALDTFSTTLGELTTTTYLVPVRATTTETSTITVKKTATSTFVIPTSSGYLPVGSTFLNQGIYANSLPGPVSSRSQPLLLERGLLQRGNITIVTGDKESVFDDADCICDSDRNIFPGSVECIQVLKVYHHEQVYMEADTIITSTLPAVISTIVSTKTVTTAITVIPENISKTLTFTATSVVTETSYTTHLDTETVTSTSTTFVETRTLTEYAACATASGAGNYIGPDSFPTKNQFFSSQGPIQWISYHSKILWDKPTVVDCCVYCQQDLKCAAMIYHPSRSNFCAIFYANEANGYEAGVANQASTAFTLELSAQNDVNETTIISNGNYGFWSGVDEG